MKYKVGQHVEIRETPDGDQLGIYDGCTGQITDVNEPHSIGPGNYWVIIEVAKFTAQEQHDHDIVACYEYPGYVAIWISESEIVRVVQGDNDA